MSIELRCPGCQNLLRVPDTAAGKQARCPQCQNVVSVPAAAVSPAGFNDSEASQQSVSKSITTPSQPYVAPDVSNPYAASGFHEESRLQSTLHELKPRQASFEEVLSVTWEIFQKHIGPLAIVGIFAFGIQAAEQIVSQVVSVVCQISGLPELQIAAGVFPYVLNFFIRPMIVLGSTIATLRLLKNGQTLPSDFWTFSPFYGSALLLNLLMGLIGLGTVLLCVGPAVAVWLASEEWIITTIILSIGSLILIAISTYVGLVYALAHVFIVDQRLGAIDAMRLSWQYMEGNKLSLFLIMLVVGIGTFLFAIITCCFGTILASPFWFLALSVFYMFATGQRDLISKDALNVIDHQQVKVGLPQ